MADLTRPLGIGNQIRLIAGLRWRMLRNGLRQRSARLDLIGMILSGLFAAVFVVGIGIGLGAGTYTLLSQGHPGWIGLFFWGIFLFWQLFPIFLAGFGPQFEFRGLLRFPFRLRAFYLVSLAYGLADFAAVASFCWLLAMTIGAGAARPDLLPAMAAICAIFLLLNVILERLLSSWLERLLARRRTRELVFGLFILLSILVQLTAQSLEKLAPPAVPWIKRIVLISAAFPPGLAGRALASAVAHDFAIFLPYATGIGAYALLFGVLLWLRLSAQYRGEELSETPAPSKPQPAMGASKTTAATQSLRWLSPQVEAVVRKEVRYLLRNSFMFLNLLLPPLLVILFSSQFAAIPRRHAGGSPRNISTDLFFPGMLAYVVLILTAPAYNCFAYESRGMQTFFTTPVRFREVFLGKNLIVVAVLTLEITLCIGTLALRVGLPAPPLFVATLAALVFSVSGQLIVANWSSLNFPRKLEFGSLRNQRASGMAVLLTFATQIVLAAACSVVFLAGRWLGNPWLPAGIFATLAVASLGGYFASLDALSEFAEKKREVLLDALCR